MSDLSKTAAHKLQMLLLENRDANRNIARFYVLAIDPTLFGEMAVVREWGRIGTNGRRRLDPHPDIASAVEALKVWLNRKVRRGYRVLMSQSPS
jgi:predicted DNA-binding WGR domain protein